ncbi:hypothetical protein AOQ84DRAFT_357085 [Glonium stellatum]|uniref:Uncharacterized protein n=1 Tax=Glonium stellatum TaxID=574774 RepID=A0A8E2ER38_9PEZI|nr:hypothetical protein AOQ84DRAFT_357085 [Glonium stellatum]
MVNFCEDCYNRHVGGRWSESEQLIYVCNPKHEFLKTPIEDWSIRDGIMKINGEEISLNAWLDYIQKSWNFGSP